MCLSIPGKIIEIYSKNNIRMGKVDMGGVIRETCLEYVPEANSGDYVIIHVGFALNLISEDEAKRTLDLIRQIAEIDEGDAIEE